MIEGMMQKREVQGDGLVRIEPVLIQRLPKEIENVGSIASLCKVDGDVFISSTDFVLIDGTTLQITLPTPMRVLYSVIAYGKAAIGCDLRMTAYLNQFNLAGDGCLSISECEHCGSLNFVGVTGELSAGLHGFDLRAKVSGGTGTIYASTAKVPLTMGLISLRGTI